MPNAGSLTGVPPSSASLFVRALLAYAIHEHQVGHCSHIDVWIRADSVTVQDDGRGMGLDRDGYVEGLMGLLVGPTGAVRLHGVGLSLIAASTPRLEVASRRAGGLWKQSFSWGLSDGPPSCEPAGPETGTCIELSGLAGLGELDRPALMKVVDAWRKTNPGLTISVHHDD